jgi:hypothetical protein
MYGPKYLSNAKTVILIYVYVPSSLYLKLKHWLSLPVNTSTV